MLKNEKFCQENTTIFILGGLAYCWNKPALLPFRRHNIVESRQKKAF